MTSEVARRRRRAALESSEATKEALGGSRTTFWRTKGKKSIRAARCAGLLESAAPCLQGCRVCGIAPDFV